MAAPVLRGLTPFTLLLYLLRMMWWTLVNAGRGKLGRHSSCILVMCLATWTSALATLLMLFPCLTVSKWWTHRLTTFTRLCIAPSPIVLSLMMLGELALG